MEISQGGLRDKLPFFLRKETVEKLRLAIQSSGVINTPCLLLNRFYPVI